MTVTSCSVASRLSWPSPEHVVAGGRERRGNDRLSLLDGNRRGRFERYACRTAPDDPGHAQAADTRSLQRGEFFVRHAYFLGANDPYKALRTTLKAESDADAWASLHSDISRPFDRPKSGRIAVKVINHLGDEVMKVFRV